MSVESLAVVLALLAAALWFWMRKSEPVEEGVADHTPSPYHCVAVLPGKNACRTAQTLKGMRFLSAEAPTLPLVSCDCTSCACTFAHFADRRHGDRRNAYSAESHSFTIQGHDERRRRRGRRQSDGMQVAHGL